jgi:hypothetical protein
MVVARASTTATRCSISSGAISGVGFAIAKTIASFAVEQIPLGQTLAYAAAALVGLSLVALVAAAAG